MTIPFSPAPIDEGDLAAWVDQRLPPGRLREVEAYLASHPTLANQLLRQRVQGAELSRALRAKYDEPIPACLRVGPMMKQRRQRVASTLARAAAVVLVMGGSAGLGWVAHRPTGPDALGSAGFGAQAAYATFTVDVRHPVEVRADESAHLQQWLSNRLARPVRAPDLSNAGWHLLGGRLLSTSDAPAALFMYDGEGGKRVTVYLQPVATDDEEFHYLRHGDVATVLWSERHLALAVTGPLARDALLHLAQLVAADVTNGDAR